MAFLSKMQLRQQMKDMRLAFDPIEKAASDRLIWARLLQNQMFQKAETMLFYVSMDSEVDTHAAISSSWALGKRVIVPKVDGKQLKLIEIKSWSELRKGYKDILEPVSDDEITDKPDLVIVPGLAFDISGHRLGYGGGYYDRLLCKGEYRSIGLCYEQMLVEHLPLEPHDIPVDCVITDKREIYIH